MDLRRFGSTDLLVSPIGLGLAALGRPGYINLGHAEALNGNYAVEDMQAHAHEVLDAAWEGGVRYFDAARSYGRAEQFLGTWLKNRNRLPEEVVVGSKWGYTYTAGWQVDAEVHEVKEHSLAVLQRQWGESQSFLSPYLDLYQIHSATFSSGVLENRDVLAELMRLKTEAGVYIGLTLSGPDQGEVLNRAVEIEFYGVRLFDAVQATYNLLEVSAAPVLEQAHAAGMGILVKEALANGRLTPQNENPDFSAKMKVLRMQAERFDTTIDALALAAVLAHSWADIVLSGAAAEEHIQSNLKAAEIQVDEEALSAFTQLVEPPEVYWNTRSSLPWT